jgi:hypothetical protein
MVLEALLDDLKKIHKVNAISGPTQFCCCVPHQLVRRTPMSHVDLFLLHHDELHGC